MHVGHGCRFEAIVVLTSAVLLLPLVMPLRLQV
jgi:hypothetical protein